MDTTDSPAPTAPGPKPRRPRRELHGVFVLDKPAGLTSFSAVSAVRRALSVDKAGHTGTLDPMATGVLPICLGDGTRLVEFLIEHDKAYLATIRLGAATDTQDREGAITETAPFAHVTEAAIREAAASFVGVTQQRVPIYSAVQVDGERLHARARRGEAIDAPLREIRIDNLEIRSIDGPDVTIHVECGKGTFIRALAADLGLRLGTVAHLAALRRTRVGAFSIEVARTLDALRAEADAVPIDEAPEETARALRLVSMREAVAELPSFALDEDEAARLSRSGQLPYASAPRFLAQGPHPRVALLSPDGRLAAIARLDETITMLRVFPKPR